MTSFSFCLREPIHKTFKVFLYFLLHPIQKCSIIFEWDSTLWKGKMNLRIRRKFSFLLDWSVANKEEELKWIAVDGKFASFDIYMLICNSFWLLLTRCILHSTAKRVKFDNLQFAKSTTFLRSMSYKCVTLMDHFMGVKSKLIIDNSSIHNKH